MSEAQKPNPQHVAPVPVMEFLDFNPEKKQAIYKIGENRVPSVTTILNKIAKPAVASWQAKMMREGKDPDQEAETAAFIGKLIHANVECVMTGKSLFIDRTKIPLPLQDRTLDKMVVMENIRAIKNKFSDFWYRSDCILQDCELVLVDEINGFGGTIDVLVRREGYKPNEVDIWDIKTSKGFYHEQKLQVGGGYSILAESNGFSVREHCLIRLPKINQEADMEDDEPEIHIIDPRVIPALRDEFMYTLAMYKSNSFSMKQLIENPGRTEKLNGCVKSNGE